MHSPNIFSHSRKARIIYLANILCNRLINLSSALIEPCLSQSEFCVIILSCNTRMSSWSSSLKCYLGSDLGGQEGGVRVLMVVGESCTEYEFGIHLAFFSSAGFWSLSLSYACCSVQCITAGSVCRDWRWLFIGPGRFRLARLTERRSRTTYV